MLPASGWMVTLTVTAFHGGNKAQNCVARTTSSYQTITARAS